MGEAEREGPRLVIMRLCTGCRHHRSGRGDFWVDHHCLHPEGQSWLGYSDTTPRQCPVAPLEGEAASAGQASGASRGKR